MDTEKTEPPHIKNKNKHYFLNYVLISPLSFIVNSLSVVLLGVFALFFSTSIRDNVIKNQILPHLTQFNIPQITYDTFLFDKKQGLVATDLSIFDSTNQKFLNINYIAVLPNDLFQLQKGLKHIKSDTITVFKNPFFSKNALSETKKHSAIPPIPCDIHALIVKNLILKPALTNQKNDMILAIKADYQKNILTINSNATTKTDLLNKYIDKSLIRHDTITASINATIDMRHYYQNSNNPIDINAQNIVIKHKNQSLSATFKTAFFSEPLKFKNTFLKLESQKSTLNFSGDITEYQINGILKAKDFDIVSFYPVIDDLQKFSLNGIVKINGKLTQIPKLDGTVSIDSIYKKTNFHANFTGLHRSKSTNIEFSIKNINQIIANAKINMNNNLSGTADIIVNPNTIPVIFQKDIPVTVNDIQIKTNFKQSNNLIFFDNGHLTLHGLKIKKQPTIPNIEFPLLTFDFNDRIDKLSIKNANFTTIINTQKYDMSLKAKFYEYYKPQIMSLNGVNQLNQSDKITLNLHHKTNVDFIEVALNHLSLDAWFGRNIPVKITDFNTYFKGTAGLFSQNIFDTIQGDFASTAQHRLNDKTHAKIDLSGHIHKRNLGGKYQLFLNNDAAGTGKIAGTMNKDIQLTDLQTITETNLDILNVFLYHTEHRITGNVFADITLDRDKLLGDIKVKNGTYTNLLHGTKIDSVTMHASVTQNAVNVINLAAKTAPTGSLNAKGIISLSPTTQSDFTITMTDIVPVKNAMLNLKADSRLNLVGNSNNLTLTGQIQLNDLLILLPDLQNNNTPKLTLIRPSDTDKLPQTEKVPLLEKIQTDIVVIITEGAKITGFGLAGFPFGTLHITGTVGTPKIDGQIDIARGKIDFFGKNFKIVSGGIAIKQTNPIFNITASHNIDKKTINLAVKGTLQNPDIVLSSTPQIPKDEIIALLIFGKDKKDLSAFQALHLANTVYQLSRGKSGAGSTFDIVGKTERLLNIDELNVNTGDNNSVNIGAGKYISEDIYVATEYNPITASSLFRLELKLSESLDLISRLNTSNKINNTNNSELMLIKKKDY